MALSSLSRINAVPVKDLLKLLSQLVPAWAPEIDPASLANIFWAVNRSCLVPDQQVAVCLTDRAEALVDHLGKDEATKIIYALPRF